MITVKPIAILLALSMLNVLSKTWRLLFAWQITAKII
jgi:hypothetical protein